MRMDEIGYNHKHDGSFYIDRPNGAGDWLLLVIKSPAIFKVNGTDISAPACSIIIYTPGVPQFYKANSNEYYDDWVHFGPDDEEEQLIRQLNIPLNEPVMVSDVTDISAIVRNMCLEHYSSNPNRTKSVDLYFRLLLYKLNEKSLMQFSSPKTAEGPYFQKLLWIRESIYRWPGRDYSIDDMARELCLSRSRFQHLYTDTFGVSVNKDIINSRLEKAAELLRNSDMSISEIASLVGYSSIQYFTRQFKSDMGLTPVQYRNSKKNTESEPVSE